MSSKPEQFVLSPRNLGLGDEQRALSARGELYLRSDSEGKQAVLQGLMTAQPAEKEFAHVSHGIESAAPL